MLLTASKRAPDSKDEGSAVAPRRAPPHWLLLTLLGSFSTIVAYIRDWEDLHGLIMKTGQIWGRDFVNVWVGAHLVIDGRTAILYRRAEYVAHLRDLVGPLEPHLYSYPPSSLFLAAPLAYLPYPVALAVWIIGSLGLFLWAARPFTKQVPSFPLLFAAITPAGIVNIWAGHYGFLIGALWLACFSRLERRPGGAGVFAALMTIKPHLGLLLPPILLARRYWKTILVASAGAVALFALSALVFGLDLWREYLTDMSRLQASLLKNRGSFFLTLMPGTYTSIRFIDSGHDAIAWSLHFCAAAAALFMVWRAERRGVKIEDLCFIAATATFLILPYAFNYDMTVVCLGFALLLFRHWPNLTRWQRAVLIGGYVSPQLTLIGQQILVPLTPIALLAALYMQVKLCTREWERNGEGAGKAVLATA